MINSKNLTRLAVELDRQTSTIYIDLLSNTTVEQGTTEIARLSLGDYPDEKTQHSLLGKLILGSLLSLSGERDTPAELDNNDFVRREVEPRAKAGDIEAQGVMAISLHNDGSSGEEPGIAG